MILLSDGFDSYYPGDLNDNDDLTTGNPAFTGYGEGLTIGTATGRFGGQSLRRNSNTNGWAPFTWGTGHRAAAFWFKYGAAPSVATPVLTQADLAHDTLTVSTAGNLVVVDGAGTTRITAALPAATYAWIELSFQASYIELRSNNVVIGSYTGSYTDPGADMQLGKPSANAGHATIDFDDVLVWDDTTANFATFGLAPRRIQLVQPDGAGASADWAPNAATNWESMVGTGWTVGNGAGVQSVASGNKDLYTLGALAMNPSAIDAITVRTSATNAGATSATIAMSLRSVSSVEATGTPFAVNESGFACIGDTFYKDPSAASWTAAAVNGLQAGLTSGV